MNLQLKEWWEKIRHSEARDVLVNNRNEIKHCPFCNGNVEDRLITLYDELINSLYDVYVWCGNNQRHEFSMKDIRHLMGHNEYARFGDLVRNAGGILYRPADEDKRKAKGSYGMNMARAKEFFQKKRSMPMEVILNQIWLSRSS